MVCRAHFSQSDMKMISVASSPLQTNHVVVASKNISFTVSHLVLKTKEVHSKTENGKKKKKKWFDDVDVHSNAPGLCNATTLEPSGFFQVLPLNFRWRYFLSLFSWPLFSQPPPLQPWFRPGAHNESVGSTSTNEGAGGKDRQNSVAPENAEHLQPLINDLLTVSRVTGNRIMWSEQEKHEQRRSDCQLRMPLD